MARPGRLCWRSLGAVLVLPGTFAFVIPWLLRPGGAELHASGLLPLGLGTLLLLWCVRDFHVAGKGTLAPWRPPERLVTDGPYRVSRNPMYVAVLTILAGWALSFRAPGLWIYTVAAAVAFHLRIVYGEEPWLARRHGARWTEYEARVPRWLFKVTIPPRHRGRHTVPEART